MLALACHIGVAKNHLARLAALTDDVITSMAALLVHLVKLTPIGYNHLRDADPEQALAVLAEADQLVDNVTREEAERRPNAGEARRGGFDDLEAVLPAEAFRHSEGPSDICRLFRTYVR